MEELVKEVSPFRRFSREEWSALRADTPMTLTQQDLDELRGLNDRIDLAEVETIYLPLSRLLNLYVAATQGLFRATNNFLHLSERKVPYVIGMAGALRWERAPLRVSCSGFSRAGRSTRRSIS
jgi:type I pantothenate kinase